jgi:hypothetical protein
MTTVGVVNNQSARTTNKYEHLVRNYGDHSNRSRGVRRLATSDQGAAVITIVANSPVDPRWNASWARVIQKVYAVDPHECTHCGATLRVVSLINFEAADPLGENAQGPERGLCILAVQRVPRGGCPVGPCGSTFVKVL